MKAIVYITTVLPLLSTRDKVGAVIKTTTGWERLIFQTVGEVTHACRVGNVNLIITDDLALLDELRSQRLEVPVVLMVDSTTQVDTKALRKEGYHDVVEPNFSAQDMKRTLGKIKIELEEKQTTIGGDKT